MDATTLQYLRRLFRNYYEKYGAKLLLPPDFTSREFAAQLWGMKSYIRHISFKTRASFEEWVREKAPRHVYYSSAVYVMPGAQNMEEKGWVGADLVFDIDADHLPGCRDKVIEIVDKERNIKTSIAPDNCLFEAAWEAAKLLDILRYELGFEPSILRVEFSGHRGFHIIVSCKVLEECFKADSSIRKELVDYIRGEMFSGLNEEIEIRSSRKKRVKIYTVPPRTEDPGIRGRIARIAVLLAKREGSEIVKRVLSAPPLEASRLYRKYSEKVDEYLSRALEEVSIEIDPQVTLDTKRLVRIPYSLHGKSGLIVEPVSPSSLLSSDWSPDRFSPFTNLDPIRIRLLVDLNDVVLFGHRLRLKAGSVYRLPAPLAIYLMSKELAVLAR